MIQLDFSLRRDELVNAAEMLRILVGDLGDEDIAHGSIQVRRDTCNTLEAVMAVMTGVAADLDKITGSVGIPIDPPAKILLLSREWISWIACQGYNAAAVSRGEQRPRIPWEAASPAVRWYAVNTARAVIRGTISARKALEANPEAEPPKPPGSAPVAIKRAVRR
jgi:hypothetical protein